MTTKFSAQLRRITTVSALGLTLVGLPTFMTTAEAKPPKHAPAWGYRAKHDDTRDWKDHDRDRDRDDWRDKDDWRKRSSSKNSWSKKTWSKSSSSRRYRIRYRTAYNRYGRPYKVAYRAYY